jgi:hypothetical protein
MTRRAYIGSNGRAAQLSLDARSLEVLADAIERLSEFTGKHLTASGIVRYAIIEQLGELVSVLDDMGEPDKRELRDKLIEARTCRPAESSSS